MRPLAFLLAALLALTAQAQAVQPKVRYALAVYQTGTTTAITKIAAGQDFDLTMLVQDLRAPGTYVPTEGQYAGQTRDLTRGVFAAYSDILYSKRYATVHPAQAVTKFSDSFTFASPYVNGQNAADLADRIGALGAFSGFDNPGTALMEVVRVRMQAHFPATIQPGISSATALFQFNFSTLKHPDFDTLVYGNTAATPPEESAVLPDEIQSGWVMLTVTR